jgi:hypothetical protein
VDAAAHIAVWQQAVEKRLLIPGEAAHQNEMMSPVVTE